MRMIIGGALVALGLAGAAAAQEQEQFASFARVAGRFVALQTRAQDADEPSSSFRFLRVRTGEATDNEAPFVREAAVAAKLPGQATVEAMSKTAPHITAAELKRSR